MDQPLIQLEDIRRTFHVGDIDIPVLKGISLEINRGELVSLTGSSGSGKSTLMNILGCLDRPTSGSYKLENEEVSNLSADKRALIRNRKIGFVFQSFNLLSRTTALEQVTMPLAYTNAKMTDKQARQRAEELLRMVGLGERMDHTPAQLSGGQQQRIAIARALVNRPPVLFADEPTGNLDSRTTIEVLAMLQQLNKAEGITIIIVTHDPVVAAHTRRNIRLSDGLIESDTPVDTKIATVPSSAPQPAGANA
ncbi:MAG: ABC transporter ATP-binding protein [Phycisphaerales bacterium]